MLTGCSKQTNSLTDETKECCKFARLRILKSGCRFITHAEFAFFKRNIYRIQWTNARQDWRFIRNSAHDEDVPAFSHWRRHVCIVHSIFRCSVSAERVRLGVRNYTDILNIFSYWMSWYIKGCPAAWQYTNFLATLQNRISDIIKGIFTILRGNEKKKQQKNYRIQECPFMGKIEYQNKDEFIFFSMLILLVFHDGNEQNLSRIYTCPCA